MAVIGDQLSVPETGWKRYDGQSSQVKFIGTWLSTSNASYYSGTNIYSSDVNAKASFNFVGTKLRIIGYRDPARGNVKIKIDGTEEVFSQNGVSQFQILGYEKFNLSDEEHTVELSFVTGSFDLDAIDIDSTGRLLHPDEVTNITDLEIGKRIRCNYVVATSGKSGTLGNLGKEISSMVSTPTNIPNVDFYFIMVDEYNGKKVLVADRNIQASISWDALNGEGLIFGVQKNLDDNSRFKFVLRVISGGIDSINKDNEWDKYIVNSTLNGKITAGDNNVWNWSGVVRSWTSTTYPSYSDKRVQRGGTTADAFIQNNNGSITTNTSSTVTGYRPVLEVEILPLNRTFINHDGSYKKIDTLTGMWKTISATLPSEDTFINDGMDDLSVLDRKNKDFTMNMTANGSLGSGKIFKGSVDLKKYFEITKLTVK